MARSIRRLLRVGLAVAVGVCAVMAAAAYGMAVRSPNPVGFQVIRARDGENRPFAIAVWYPTTSSAWSLTPVGSMLTQVARDGKVAGTSLPLVLISHGNGGGPASHADLAMALASAGFVVAAPVHLGDNVADQSALASASFFQDRTDQLSHTIDHMVHEWEYRDRLDSSRVAAHGFSAGGATVLGAVGAQYGLERLGSVCGTDRGQAREFVCDVLRASGSPLLGDRATAGADHSCLIGVFAPPCCAPGLAFLLDSASTAGIHVPLQVWSGDADDRVPTATNAAHLRALLPKLVELHDVKGAGHMSFLAPCRLLRPAALCRDAQGVDREAVHARMNTAVIAFLQRQLPTSASHAER